MVPSWSFSKRSDFDTCKKMFWLKHDQKIPEPERPLPPGKTEHANDRGTRVHDNCELYVSGRSDDLCPEADKFFGSRLDWLRMLYAEGAVSLEGEWGMDTNWEVTEWKGAWLRLKLDAIVFHSPTEATVIDYKTGRKFGNEVKHAEQLNLYQLVAFLRYPQLERVHAALWYFDQDEVTDRVFTRMQGLRFRQNFNIKGVELTSCTAFPPNPNVFSCKWCAYGPWGTNHCAVGVKKT
ncbi:PD-(D/E)XK nuclease family protein [Variovorax sp. J22R133]|uniref:PD-(D/E)XK nuclease family protein n=1 Tax=Variovorax brevis TaxID=3053503 RepID=UPI002578AB24|nr:PD-(D/E)XK nuclease family protein [Variovorax sp. J22R133]MDM0116878.1 PD-(D/E)XK nuclease family protein [Variovorax sp. J22R133]